jgi:stage II sporulation protein D
VELTSTTDAVTATKSEVITYRGQIIKAYFSANSGGITCTVSECFDLPDLPYIEQIKDAADITTLPGGTWGTKANLTPAAIRDQLITYGVNLPHPVARLEALTRGPSGRTWRLRVHLTVGDAIDLDETQTRKIMHLYGPIRSFLYDLGDMESGKQKIVGHGFGHGVGLSQWGAQSFAKQGWSAHKILLYYYRNVAIQKL